ncbi:alanine dehydrogenase [Cupriavidus consociatus]|uniref:alanine dehydrogenase n=1 Tax=Cupriavidus consociatus TaxID=2821357 RepID=UPI001AE1021B|nr:MULTISPECIES: alanine dehydrogenase [unclassified Cupriavidus]MBP0618562.1 alanine dehydrogenase [Cupriavidus sp. LEh25]MDK2655198.1 alanine dehydrogenase [Cupriavidus sp. LEh21]
MWIGVPKEIKDQEYRVGLTPACVRELVSHGHAVMIQAGAGAAVGLSDRQYEAAGGQLAADAMSVYDRAEMIVKVKEPQPSELALLKAGQILYTYLHLAADRSLTAGLVRSGAICIAYETVTGPDGGLPLLAPMSEVAGRMSVQVAAAHLEKPRGGMGLLLGGVPGVAPAHVVVIGAGVVGTNALQIAVGMGARVTVLDKNVDRLRHLSLVYGNRVTGLYSTTDSIERALLSADVVIGAVLVPGGEAPKLVTRAMVARMKAGSVMVDVAIDQGGCFETSRPTSHTAPTYVVDGVLHYCVTNMPAAVARTSTFALNNATIGYALAIADKGWLRALAEDAYLRAGLNICRGHVTYAAVASAHGYMHVPAEEVLV